MTATASPRDAALTQLTCGQFEVELFGPVEMPDGSQRIGHHYRRFFANVEDATAPIRSWLNGDLVPAGIDKCLVTS